MRSIVAILILLVSTSYAKCLIVLMIDLMICYIRGLAKQSMDSSIAALGLGYEAAGCFNGDIHDLSCREPRKAILWILALLL